MAKHKFPVWSWLTIAYRPEPEACSFAHRSQTQTADGIEVQAAVLDTVESKQYFGVPMARRGIQPVYLRIHNQSDVTYRLNMLSIDPNYYSSREAAGACHYSIGRKILEYGALAFLFLPLIFLILPFKIFGGWRANRLMDAFFDAHAFRLRPIRPGEISEGFVFTPLDAGSKTVHVKLLSFASHEASLEFAFTIQVPGLKADYLRHNFATLYSPNELIPCEIPELRKRVAEAPRATTNKHGTREGDPVNLVVVGDFPTLLSAFGARWDETETITLDTCWKTFKSFFIGSEYRYSPVSALYLFGRSQDFALQRTRSSINERLHLRLWMTPLVFQGQPVWIGQVSRDIGVRITWRTWNLTTHRIDGDTDEARDYVVEDLLQAERLELAAYLDGVGECTAENPRRNLTGDPYFTDGRRAAMLVSPARTAPTFISWH